MIGVHIVLPIQTPYWVARFKWLSRDPRIRWTVLLENEQFEHRPGWQPVSIDGIRTVVLGGATWRVKNKNPETGISIKGVRSISWRLFLWIIRERPNVVIVCNATQLIIAKIACMHVGARLVLLVEDTRQALKRLRSVKALLKRFTYRRADYWFAFSNDSMELLAEYGVKRNVTRTSWSVETRRFSGECMDSSEDKGNGNEEGRVLLFVGALIRRKGILELIESWLSLTAEEKKGGILRIVGSGPLDGWLQEVIQKRGDATIEFFGQKKYEEVIELYQAADILILPTLEDLFSLTVVEAMAAGCAVITTPYNGARELVEHEKNGWIVDPLDPENMKEVLREALSVENGRLKQMQKRSLEKAQELDNQVVMKRFADALVEIAR